MSWIDVNLAGSRDSASKLVPIATIVGDTADHFRKMQSMIDRRILNLKNLNARMTNVVRETGFIAQDIRKMHIVITEILNRYENTDQGLASQAPSLDLGGTGSSKHVNAFVASNRSIDTALDRARLGANFAKTGAPVVGVLSVARLSAATSATGHINVSGSKGVRAFTGIKGTRYTASTFNSKVTQAGTSKSSIAGKVGAGASIAYGGATIISGIRNDIASGASARTVAANAAVETGQQAFRHGVTKKTVTSFTAKGAKWGSLAGPKGAIAGAAVGAIAGVVASGVITQVGRNVINGAANMGRNLLRRLRR